MPKTKRESTPYIKIQSTGRRLTLRPYKLSDFKALEASHISRLPPVDKFDEPVPTIKELDYKKYKKRVLRHRAHGKSGHHFIFGVFEKKTGAYVGQIDVFTINKRLRWANIGYHIQNQYFGKGYASEAGRLALQIVFNQLNFHRVEAGTELENKASQKVALKIGLRPEGVRKKFFPDNGGIDMLFYATNAFDF